jgi:PTS system beta-glucosides-specific IIC component
MDYQALGKSILEKVGGESNISALNHCATRLRFNLKDESIPVDADVKAIPGVMGVVRKGGQYQVVIGSDVANVYNVINDLASIGEGSDGDKPKEKKKVLDVIIDTMSGIFTPILPAITAAGMIKAVLALLVAFKVVNSEATVYQVLNFMADAAFYFLPILLASSAAKKFKCNPYLAMMLGGILLHPNFISMVNASKESGEAIKFTLFTITNASYSSSVLPIILIVWFMSYVEPIADKISPKPVKFFTKPLITILVTGLVGLIIIGPIGYIISNYIAAAVNGLNTYCSWLVPVLVGTLTPLLVMTGTHYGLIPIGINNRMTIGHDTLIYPGMLASNVAQGGAALAVSIKSKDKDVKALASSAGITAVCGITEPALYGVNLRFKTPLYAAMVGGGVGGLFMGIFKVKNYSGGSPGFLTLPSYIGDDTLTSFYFACIGAVISVVIAFIVTLIIYKDEKKEEIVETTDESKAEGKNAAEEKEIELTAPITGEAVDLNKVDDPTFSEEILGKGAAIIPSEGKVVAPFDGTVVSVFDTKHAIALESDNGLELLIHIGLDTVKLGGKYYEAKVENGAKIKRGQELITFDMDKIKEEGYDIITPVVVTNPDDYTDFDAVSGTVAMNDHFMTVK